jgi:hypothetical protein
MKREKIKTPKERQSIERKKGKENNEKILRYIYKEK